MRTLFILFLVYPVFAQILQTDCDTCLDFESSEAIVIKCSTVIIKNTTTVRVKEGLALFDGNKSYVGEVTLQEGVYDLVNLDGGETDVLQARTEQMFRLSLLIFFGFFLLSF